MTRFLRELRLLPIAVVACLCLFALIAADLVLDDDPRPAGAANRSSPPGGSWASQMFNFPDGRNAQAQQDPPRQDLPRIVGITRSDRLNPDITGSVPEAPPKDQKEAKSDTKADTKADDKAADAKPPQPKAPETKPAGTVIPLDGSPSGAERAILERLQERREELDKRARELDIRESLIAAAEKRMDGKLVALKETEQRITVATQQKDDAQAAQFKGLVTMYENMKPRDAAKIFDRMEPNVLLDIASKIEPRKMADVMAQMTPDTAQRLTVELANKAQDGNAGAGATNSLPKIQGQPATQ
jgi:flagellar motility protein MotE (MotC chaperone)